MLFRGKFHSSTPSNEEVFHRILQRGCKDVGPRGPGSISLRLVQALISHYYSDKTERVNMGMYSRHSKHDSPHIIFNAQYRSVY